MPSEPASDDPPVIESADMEPAISEPAISEPAISESAISELAISEPAELVVVDGASTQPKWLHPISLLFEFASGIRNQLFPAVIALLSAARGGVIGLWIAIVFFAASMLLAVFRYVTLRYQLRDGELVVDEGLLFRRHRTVPVQRIQNIDMVQNVLHRLFRVAEVRIETATGKEPEATLRVLAIAEVELLRRQVFRLREKRNVEWCVAHSTNSVEEIEDPRSGATDESSASPLTEALFKIPTPLLIKAGLIGDRGMVLVAVIVGMIFQVDWDERFRFRWNMPNWNKYFPAIEEYWKLGLLALLAMVAFFIVLKVFSAVWYVLKFYGYQLELHGEDLRIHCGLLTKISATVPRKRIQFISVHRTWLGRALQVASIRIETAGGGGEQKDNATSSVSRRWFVPAIHERDVASLIGRIRPDLEWNEKQWDWRPLSPRASHRLTRMAIFVSLIVMAVGIFNLRYWGILIGLTVMLLGFWLARKKAKATRYARSDFGVAYRSGILTKKTSVAFFDKLQAVVVMESPFDRRWNMATLSIDTAAAGPAEHQIEVAMLDASFARQEYEAIGKMASLKVQKIDHQQSIDRLQHPVSVGVEVGGRGNIGTGDQLAGSTAVDQIDDQ